MTQYKIIDHGLFERFQPDLTDPMFEHDADGLPEGMVVLYCRRVSDKQEWTHYRDSGNFHLGSVFACVLPYPGTDKEIVKGVFRDVTMVFPGIQRLIEILSVPEDIKSVHDLFTEKRYLPDTQEIVDYVEPVRAVFDWQFAGQAAVEGIISEADALAWNGGKIPDVLIRAIDTRIPPEMQFKVKMFLSGTSTYDLHHPYVPLLGQLFGKDTPEKLAEFWFNASNR